MLLAFDRVYFLDPVLDEDWRAQLFIELEEQEDETFFKYRKLKQPLDELRQEGVIRVLAPHDVEVMRKRTVSASAISDLLDTKWVKAASHPGSFGLPYRALGDNDLPTWQIFRAKMPDEFVNILRGDDFLRTHLIHEGTPRSSWTLSYSAGSAISISVHLAASEELGLSPVTDSPMHHQLVLRKLLREKYGNDETKPRPVPENTAKVLAYQSALTVIDDILPKSKLAKITFSEILEFRSKTAKVRRQFVDELETQLATLSRTPDPENMLLAQRELQSSLQKQLRSYRADLANARTKIWPHLVSSLTIAAPTGSLAAIAFSHIGSPGYALCASIGTAALALLKGGLDVKAEIEKVKRSASPGVAYLSSLTDIA
jgi:hypothetical protein